MWKTINTLWMVLWALSLPASAASSWRDLGFPHDGEVTALAGGPGILYAGTVRGKLYNSTDGGATWKLNGEVYSPVRSLLVRENTAYLGAGHDHHLPYNSRLSSCMEFFFGCERFPTEEGGLFYTGIQSVNWQASRMNAPVDPAPKAFSVRSMTLREGTLFAGSPRGIYFLEPRSDSWFFHSPADGLPSNSPRFGRNSVHSLEWIDSTLFALTDSAFYSTRLSPAPLDPIPLWSEQPLRGKALAKIGKVLLGGGDFHLLLAEGRILYGARGRELLKSDDTGRTWTAAAPLAPGRPTCLRIQAGGLLAGMEGQSGVFRVPTGGLAWSTMGKGFHGRSRALAVVGGRVWAGTDGAGAFTLDLAGTGWTRAAGPGSIFNMAVVGQTVYAGSDSVWALDAGGGPPRLRDHHGNSRITGMAGGRDWLAVAREHRIFRCREGREPCAEVAVGLVPPFNGADGSNASTFRGIGGRGDTLFILYGNLYRTLDAGDHWQDLGPVEAGSRLHFAEGRPVLSRFQTWPMHYSRVLVSVSEDLGQSWQPAGIVEEAGSEVYDFVGAGANMYMATAFGVFVRRGAGPWARFTQGLPWGPIHKLASEGGILVAAHGDAGIYAMDLEGVRIHAGRSATQRRPSAAGIPLGLAPDEAGRWRRMDGRAVGKPMGKD